MTIKCKEFLPVLNHISLDIVKAVMFFTSVLMFMGALFFIITIFSNNLDSKTKFVCILSIVLLLSSSSMLYQQFKDFVKTYDNLDKLQFNQGYRHLNWLLDIPLIIIIFMKTYGTSLRFKDYVINCSLGISMVFLGYSARFIDTNLSDKNDRIFYYTMNGISTTFLLILFFRLKPQVLNLPYCILVFSWLLYLPSYYIDVNHRFSKNCPATFEPYQVVVQQIGYSISDVLSKLVYTLVLYYVNQ